VLIEEFVTKHGAPVEPYLIYDEQVLAEPHEIGWWDDGPESDELRDLELKDVNYILEEWDGYVDVQIDDWDLEEEELINPIIYAGKVTLTIPGMYDEEDDDDTEEEEWDDDTWEEDDGPEYDSAGFTHEDN